MSLERYELLLSISHLRRCCAAPVQDPALLAAAVVPLGAPTFFQNILPEDSLPRQELRTQRDDRTPVLPEQRLSVHKLRLRDGGVNVGYWDLSTAIFKKFLPLPCQHLPILDFFSDSGGT